MLLRGIHRQDKKAIAEEIIKESLDEGFATFDNIKTLDIRYPEKVNKMTEGKINFASQVEIEFIKKALGMDAMMTIRL
ncbi:hypothetical protein HZI73_13805 [Vallitalea pronyensis]|uniref:Uncharacterized protein n=1 Tax=Vallitalea pronyensis TaxID=1348613 RepID=A0A8J8MKR5_9FIRM|nr:hypothetical protein [Vallitalea pronyensis]QUI23296.1 hypothetical protein HZI73_13805 [Vallitalea pronyensis]